MESTVTGLTGTYTVQHPDRVAASEVIEFLEQAGKIPFRSITRGGFGVSLALGGDGVEVVIDGEPYSIMIFGKTIGVLPVPPGEA
jgi:hypothetical protein